jgi:hypothetical protein
MTGEILHVDGGFHAMGAPLDTRQAEETDDDAASSSDQAEPEASAADE